MYFNTMMTGVLKKAHLTIIISIHMASLKIFVLIVVQKKVIAEDFVIDVDLPVPESKQMGTYTLKDINGTRLQFSGPLFMPWKMIAIRME